MALAIDGTPVNGSVVTGSSFTMTLASISAGSIIVIHAGGERATAAGSHATISVASTTLGSFAKRADGSIDDAGAFSAYNYGGYWWAYTSGALTNEVITVSYSATIDHGVGMAFAVKGFTGGSYSSNPWDQNSSLGQASLTTATALAVPSISNISTTNANTMLLGLLLGPYGSLMAASTPFTLITNVSSTAGGTNEFSGSSEYEVVSAVQSSITVQIGNGSAANTWMMWSDALSQTGGAGGGGGGSPFVPYTPWPQMGPMVAQ